MATTRKKKSTKRAPARKKPARKKATKKKATRKKSAKKSPRRKATKKGPALRKVPYVEYELVWDETRDHCHFGHRSGCASEVGCGLTDTVTVFKDSNGQYYVLSVNYTEGYACVEILDDDHDDPVVGIQFMGPADMAKTFSRDITKIPSKELASALAGMCL